MPERIRLDGKAVVAGAAGVIGTATVRLLPKRGARIAAVDRKEQRRPHRRLTFQSSYQKVFC
jgi:nucleoside-diphosphate-sugar epimerase